MKKLILLIAIIFCAGYVHGQVVIRKPNIFPGLKIKNTTQDVEISAAEVKDTIGTGMNWDFSGLVKDGNPEVNEVDVLNASATPYASVFPEANLAWLVSDSSGTGYAYVKLTDSELEVHGIATEKDTSKYIDPMLVMKFPFAYGNQFTDKTIFDAEGQLIEQNRIVKYVASGNLRTPDKLHNNVALIKSIEAFEMLGFTFKSESLVWYDENFQELMSINISYPALPGGEITYSAAYNITAPSSIEQRLEQKFTIYPNPASGYFSIVNSGTITQVIVSDIIGRTIDQIDVSFGENIVNINTEYYNAGIYNVKIVDHSGGETVQKLVIK